MNVRRLAAGLVVLVLSPLALVAPAAAHASLLRSAPMANSVLESGPPAIELFFDEPIEVSLSSIELFDGTGEVVDLGDVEPGGTDNDLRAVAPDLGDGVYAVRWTVTSVDGHVIDGSFAFQIGTGVGSDADALLASLDDTSTSGHSLAVLSRIVRLVGLATAIGGLVWARWSRARRIVITGSVLAVIGSVGALAAFVTATDRGVGAALRVTTGRMHLLAVLATATLAALTVTNRWREVWWRLGVALAAGASLVGFSASGHAMASTPAWLWVAVDMVHLAAVAAWFGGLVVFATAPRSVLETPGAERSVRQFSTLATVAMPVVVLTGVAQTLRLAGGLDDVTATDWGRLLLVKVVLVAAVVTMAGAARWLLTHEGSGSLRRTMVVEAVVGLAVLALVGVMVGASPRPAAAASPFEATLAVDGALAEVSVLPGVVGVNELHIVVTPPGGSLEPIADLSARVVPVGSDEAPTPATLTRDGADHFIGTVTFVESGEWTLELVVSVDASTSSIVRTVLTIP